MIFIEIVFKLGPQTLHRNVSYKTPTQVVGVVLSKPVVNHLLVYTYIYVNKYIYNFCDYD